MGEIEEFLNVSSGSGSGYGSGYGDGDGSGYGDGDGSGYGYGSGFGSGSGYGEGYGYGSGSGYGYGSGSGYGDGYGSGSGSGYGSGYGYGSGSGYGDGDGSGYGDGGGIKTFCGKKVYIIDEVQTIIESVRANIARGYILQKDFTLTPCYVVKENGKFAHGNTLREAFEALQEKLYDDSTEEERLDKFREHFTDFSKKYPARELFVWHHILTGSCKAGRESFCRDNGIDIENSTFTIYEFISLTKDSYGGETIKKLIDNERD